MKLNLRIDPYHYPILIILAFVIGFVLAIALGFGPEHGPGSAGNQIFVLPSLLQMLPLDMDDIS